MIDVEIRIGTRGSALAMIQARLVAAALEAEGAVPRLVVVETDGDRHALDSAWGDGVFVAAIELELLAGRIDVAVHSAKDLPTAADERLRIAAYLPRADPRDALVIRPGFGACLDDLPAGARIGTDSPRRTGFLLARRPDLTLRPLDGNVDTRLRRLDAGEVDGLVLASAGLDRLGRADRIAERLNPADVPPAPGQGAIAVQARSDDPIAAVVAGLDDPGTRQVVEAERAFLAACGGGCRSPIGALATLHDGILDIHGGRVAVDGTNPRFARTSGPVGTAAELVADLAAKVCAGGPDEDGASLSGPRLRPRVIVTRQESQGRPLMWALRDLALEPVAVPAIAVEIGPAGGELDAALRRIARYAWVVVTSGNGARAVLQAAERVRTPFEATRWAVIGRQTREILERGGVEVRFQPRVATAQALGQGLPVAAGEHVLVVRGSLGGDDLGVLLTARGAVVHEAVAYRTEEAPVSSRGLLRAATESGPLRAVIFTSSSTVRGLLRLATADGVDLSALPAICIGPETARVAAAAGFEVVGIATSPESSDLAEATARGIRETCTRMASLATGGGPSS